MTTHPPNAIHMSTKPKTLPDHHAPKGPRAMSLRASTRVSLTAPFTSFGQRQAPVGHRVTAKVCNVWVSTARTQKTLRNRIRNLPWHCRIQEAELHQQTFRPYFAISGVRAPPTPGDFVTVAAVVALHQAISEDRASPTPTDFATVVPAAVTLCFTISGC